MSMFLLVLFEVSIFKEGKDWSRNNRNIFKRGVSGKGGNRIKIFSFSVFIIFIGILVFIIVIVAD